MGGWRSAGPGSHHRTSARPPTRRPSCCSCPTHSTGWGTTRVAFKTDQRNERSQAAIARLGAVYEGLLRHQFRMPDGYMRSSVYFSILADEWPAVKERLTARLDT